MDRATLHAPHVAHTPWRQLLFSWLLSGSGFVYKHGLLAFEDFFETPLLIVSGLLRDSPPRCIVGDGTSFCWLCTHKPT